MLVGVLSDTHDDMKRIGEAVALMNERKVEHVIHAGDVISPFTFEILGDLACPFSGIFGNNDGDRVLLTEKSGGRISVQPRELELFGRRIVVVHEPAPVEALAASGLYDVVVYGHSHTPVVKMTGRTLVLNPGKTATLHKGRSTVALLDLRTLHVDIVEL